MRIDVAAKRYFVLIVCFGLGAAAYFQASGLMRLIATVLIPPAASGPRGVRLAPPPEVQEHETSAAAILERNPFDSITGGDLGKNGAPPPALPHERLASDAPRCDGAQVILISESDEEDWSFAAMAAPGKPPMLRRVGDTIGPYTVSAIGRYRVWLDSKNGKCQVVLGDVAPRAKAVASVVAPPTGPGLLPADLAARIRKVGDREYTVEKSAMEAILSRQAELLGSLRVFPVRGPGGEMAGLRVRGVKPGSLLATVGMQDNDQLQRINGFNLADPTAALEAYSKLQAADHLTLSLQRGGQPMDITLRIQ